MRLKALHSAELLQPPPGSSATPAAPDAGQRTPPARAGALPMWPIPTRAGAGGGLLSPGLSALLAPTRPPAAAASHSAAGGPAGEQGLDAPAQQISCGSGRTLSINACNCCCQPR